MVVHGARPSAHVRSGRGLLHERLICQYVNIAYTAEHRGILSGARMAVAALLRVVGRGGGAVGGTLHSQQAALQGSIACLTGGIVLCVGRRCCAAPCWAVLQTLCALCSKRA